MIEYCKECKGISRKIQRGIEGDLNGGIRGDYLKLQQVQQETERNDTELGTTGVDFSKFWTELRITIV